MTVAGGAARMPRRLQAERPAVSVDELKRAWVAVQEGHFRPTTRPHPLARSRCAADLASNDLASHSTNHGPGHGWTPEPYELVLPVIGCAGSVGTTTVALGVALAADTSARVVECCSVTASGLAAASSDELGLHESGWRQGKRDRVLLERANDLLIRVDEVPMPTPASSMGSAPAA